MSEPIEISYAAGYHRCRRMRPFRTVSVEKKTLRCVLEKAHADLGVDELCEVLEGRMAVMATEVLLCALRSFKTLDTIPFQSLKRGYLPFGKPGNGKSTICYRKPWKPAIRLDLSALCHMHRVWIPHLLALMMIWMRLPSDFSFASHMFFKEQRVVETWHNNWLAWEGRLIPTEQELLPSRRPPAQYPIHAHFIV